MSKITQNYSNLLSRCFLSANEKMLDIIIRRGGEINKKDNNNNTALHMAALNSNGHIW